MIENKQSSADHTLHLSPSHWGPGRRRGYKFLYPVKANLFFFFQGEEAT